MGYRSGAEGFNQAINAIAGFFDDRATRLREEQAQLFDSALTAKGEVANQVGQIQTALAQPDLDEQTKTFLQQRLNELQELTAMPLDGADGNTLSSYLERTQNVLSQTYEIEGMEQPTSLEGALAQAQAQALEVARNREAALAAVNTLSPVLGAADIDAETKTSLFDSFLAGGNAEFIPEAQLSALGVLAGFEDGNAIKLREQQIRQGELSIEQAEQTIDIRQWNFDNAQQDRAYETVDALRKNIASAVQAGDVFSLRSYKMALQNPQANPVLTERLGQLGVTAEQLDEKIERAQRREDIQMADQETRLALASENLRAARFANTQAEADSDLQRALLEARVQGAQTNAQLSLIDYSTRTYSTVEQFDADSAQLTQLGYSPQEIASMRAAVRTNEEIIGKDEARQNLAAFTQVRPPAEELDSWGASFVRLAQEAGFSEDEAIAMADGWMAAYQREAGDDDLRTQELTFKAQLAEMDVNAAVEAGEDPPDRSDLRLELNAQADLLRNRQADNGCLPFSSVSALVGFQATQAMEAEYSETRANRDEGVCNRLDRDLASIEESLNVLSVQGVGAAVETRAEGLNFEVSGGEPQGEPAGERLFEPEGGAFRTGAESSYSDLTLTPTDSGEPIVVPGARVTEVAQMYRPDMSDEQFDNLLDQLDRMFPGQGEVAAAVLNRVQSQKGFRR